MAGEKIDIIQWDADIKKYIANSLAPAKVNEVELNEEEQSAIVTVPKDQLSLAIGREAQNVRLAVQLTTWAISIRDEDSGELVETASDKKRKKEKAELSSEKVEEKIEEEGTVKEKKIKKPPVKKVKKKKEKKEELETEEIVEEVVEKKEE